MLESIVRPSLLRRACRAIVGIGVPAFFLVRLLAPFRSVIYVSWEPFEIETNTIPSRLPALAAEVLYGYPNTLLALGVLLAALGFRCRRVRGQRGAVVWLPVCFLPAYVFGIEAVKHIRAVTRRHYWTSDPPDLRTETSTAFAGSVTVLLLTLLAGSLAAAALGHWRTKGGVALSIPPVVLAIVLAVGLDWYVWWAVIQPVR